MSSKILSWHTVKSRLYRRFWLVSSLLALLCIISSLAMAGGNQMESPSQLDEFVVCGDPALQWQPHVDNSTIVASGIPGLH